MAIDAFGNAMPRVMNVGRNPAYPALKALKPMAGSPAESLCASAGISKNLIEQDHRTVKKRAWLAKGYGSLGSEWRTLQGIETVEMIRKGQVRWLAKGDAACHAYFIAELFGLSVLDSPTDHVLR